MNAPSKKNIEKLSLIKFIRLYAVSQARYDSFGSYVFNIINRWPLYRQLTKSYRTLTKSIDSLTKSAFFLQSFLMNLAINPYYSSKILNEMKYKYLFLVLGSIVTSLGINYYYKAYSSPSVYRLSQQNNGYLDESQKQLTEVQPENIDKDLSNNNIKVALLLDTSGSMNGLIEQAKSQLWQILNHLAQTEKENGDESELQIALYEYGNPSKSSNTKQINLLSPFTTDMDFISKKLFALSTDGGEEYCGEMIWTSLEDLSWGQNPNDMKMIYIAGNEEFTQGPIDFKKACKKAINTGVVVNTIFCGNWQTGVQTQWKEGAKIGEGEYMNIDHNARTVYIDTPYDEDINRLNQRLNNTYIPYGRKGHLKKENQRLQDTNANSYSKSNAAERTLFKSSKKYKADDWDLIDAYKKDKQILSNTELLADTLQHLSIEELEQRIENASTERESLQKKIQDINIKREAYIEKQTKENTEEKSLKNSIKKSIKKQAHKKGFIIKS